MRKCLLLMPAFLTVLACTGTGDCIDQYQDTIIVSNVAELVNAVEQANQRGNLTILLEDGTYILDDMLWISGVNVTLRSLSTNRDAVIVRGHGMDGDVSHIFQASGDYFTLADMTIGWVANHAVQIHGEEDADYPHIYNVRFFDTGEQMLKVSFASGDGTSSDGGIVEGCVFEYSGGVGPQYYIGGIDAHQTNDWIIRGNIFMGIRSPEEELAEHAIHFWSDSSGTLIERNVIINCDRGIGFGLGDRGHSGGVIKNNFVYTTRDVGIGLENASNAKVYNNTVFTENYDNSIEYRFSGSYGISIINNLTNAQITSRDGGRATVETNVTSAEESWFVDATGGDLHLAEPVPTVIDQGQFLSDVTDDIDSEGRPHGSGYEIGADEVEF